MYRVQEPTVPVGPVAPPPRTLTGVAALTFVYPDGPHDAEALIVDPSSGELFIVTKEALGTGRCSGLRHASPRARSRHFPKSRPCRSGSAAR